MSYKCCLSVFLGCCLIPHVQTEESAVAKRLGSASTRPARLTQKYWEDEFQKVIKGAGSCSAAISSAQVVFYPFSGADVWSALAVQPQAEEYWLIDRWAVNLTAVTRSRISSNRIAKVLSAQVGFQFGHLVKRFALEFGMASLLIAALGARSDIVLFKIEEIESQLSLHCRRRKDTSIFILRYLTVDLHKETTDLSATLFSLQEKNAPQRSILTLLKATELALRKRDLKLARLGAAPRASAILYASHRRDEAAQGATEAILQYSDFIIQDLTGVSITKLTTWASTLHLFGTYADVHSSGPDAAALDSLFLRQPSRIHSLGRLRFGYCLEVNIAATNQDTTLLENLKRHAPQSSTTAHNVTLLPAFDSYFNLLPEQPNFSSNKESQSISGGPPAATPTTINHYCHMLLACRRQCDR